MVGPAHQFKRYQRRRAWKIFRDLPDNGRVDRYLRDAPDRKPPAAVGRAGLEAVRAGELAGGEMDGVLRDEQAVFGMGPQCLFWPRKRTEWLSHL